MILNSKLRLILSSAEIVELPKNLSDIIKNGFKIVDNRFHILNDMKLTTEFKTNLFFDDIGYEVFLIQ